MTNNCYSPRGVYDVYRVENPVELNLYCRKRIIRNRLFYRLFRGRMYWVSLDVLHKIHEIYTTVSWKIHRMEGRAQYRIHRIAHFERIVCKVAKLEAPIIVAFTALYVKALLYGCAMIALIN